MTRMRRSTSTAALMAGKSSSRAQLERQFYATVKATSMAMGALARELKPRCHAAAGTGIANRRGPCTTFPHAIPLDSLPHPGGPARDERLMLKGLLGGMSVVKETGRSEIALLASGETTV